MDCGQIRKKLYDYTKSEASKKETAAIKKHLALCPSCEEEYLRVKGIKALFSAQLVPPSRRILKNIKKASKKEQTFLSGLLSPKPLFGLSAALLLFIAAFTINSNIRESKYREISSFLLDSYKLGITVETESRDYMFSTAIFNKNTDYYEEVN